jgi:branched-chain amino acid transport system permease protein
MTATVIDLTDDDPTVVIEVMTDEFRPSVAGWVARGAVYALVAFGVLLLPHLVLERIDFVALATAAVFAIFGISLNVLLGYTGTISLGHQAFVGVGAYASAYVVSELDQPFLLGVAAAGIVGAGQAMVLGGLALRVTGLYFALLTLAYGQFAQDTLFGIEAITGGGAGRAAPMPTGEENFVPYYYVCLAFLAAVLWVDWRLLRTKAGRALLALRENSRVAATFGVDVKAYLVLGFAISGVFAGIGGALYAHLNGFVDPNEFSLQLALLLVLMTVVGGLRNRTGIVIASALTALTDLLIRKTPGFEEALRDLPTTIPVVVIVIGAGLVAGGAFRHRLPLLAIGGALVVVAALVLSPVEVVLLEPHLHQLPNLTPPLFRLLVLPVVVVVTLATAPGGLGQQIRPIQRWLAGHRFEWHSSGSTEVERTDVRA